MPTRRDAIRTLGTLTAGTWLGGARSLVSPLVPSDAARSAPQPEPTPRLAPGAPTSPERLALIEAFKEQSRGIDTLFEARTFTSGWTMPYRLFKPTARGKLPLVLFLHGSGGMGTDNLKQMGLGNVFGTRVWSLPENQRRFPCWVVVPQTDRGWAHYEIPPGDSVPTMIAGLGDGARVALEIVDALCREFPIDERRIYVAGQSMGGGGVWHVTARRPRFFAAAVPCCGATTLEPAADSAPTPMWNFHGDADTTVPVRVSRERVAAVRKAGGHVIATEYAGVGHNVWEWAFTEPALVPWVFSHRR
jgi:predicted peptidase